MNNNGNLIYEPIMANIAKCSSGKLCN